MGLIADANVWDLLGIAFTVVFGPALLFYLKRLDRRNSHQHAVAHGQRLLAASEVMNRFDHQDAVLEEVRARGQRTLERLDDHIDWHAHWNARAASPRKVSDVA